MAFYMAIDLGTTGCRSIIFDDGLYALSSEYEEYGLITPNVGWVEQDAENWWEMTLRTAQKAISKSGVDPKQILGISISSQGITIVPVDNKLNPLCKALSWLDVRAEEQTAQLEKQWGQLLFEHTGKPTDACYTLPKMMWLKRECPQIWQRAWKFLMPMDFLIGKFTGNPVTDHSMASGTLMYDLKNCCWSKKVLDLYGIEEERLPQIKWSGECAGTVLPEVALQLGINEHCVVAVGAQDQKCAALGAGLCDDVMTVSLGTAGAVTKMWNEPKTDVVTNVGWCGYVEHGTWVTEGVINTAGTCLRWIRDLIYRGENYNVIDAEAQEALDRGSCLMFYPYLNGPSSPDYYPNAEGSFYGANLTTQRGDFAAAVMEGVAFQIRILLEAMDAYSSVSRLVLFGGGAKSALWCQMIANATGMEIAVPHNAEAAGAGAAMLAAKACGNDIQPMACKEIYIPTQHELYEKKYARYRSIEAKLWR